MDYNPEPEKLKAAVVAASAGDSEAFGFIYDLLYDRFYAYAYRRTGDQKVSEDIVGNSFYLMLKAIKKFNWKHEAMFYGWAFRIIANEIVNYYRDTSKYVLAEDWLEVKSDDETQTLDEKLDKDQRSDQLREALAKLSEKDRQVVEMYYFANLPHAEIGYAIGKKEGTVRVQLHRSLAQLKILLEQGATL